MEHVRAVEQGLLPGELELTIEQEVERTVPDGFRVHDAETASWVVRRIAASREYGSRVRNWAERERRRAEWEEERFLYLFGGQLRAWAEGEIARAKTRRKSVALPGGIIGFRTSKSSVVIDDEEVVLAWARENCPSAILISERLSRSAFQEHVAATGEVPEAGVHLAPQREVFFVR